MQSAINYPSRLRIDNLILNQSVYEQFNNVKAYIYFVMFLRLIYFTWLLYRAKCPNLPFAIECIRKRFNDTNTHIPITKKKLKKREKE